MRLLLILYAIAMTYVGYVTTDGSLKTSAGIVRDGLVEGYTWLIDMIGVE
jgi:hypothetical protein